MVFMFTWQYMDTISTRWIKQSHNIDIHTIYSLEKRTRQQRDVEEANKKEIESMLPNEDKMTTGMHLYLLLYWPFHK